MDLGLTGKRALVLGASKGWELPALPPCLGKVRSIAKSAAD
jgi:hypothetical protein